MPMEWQCLRGHFVIAEDKGVQGARRKMMGPDWAEAEVVTGKAEYQQLSQVAAFDDCITLCGPNRAQ
jgi:hypothetical protein